LTATMPSPIGIICAMSHNVLELFEPYRPIDGPTVYLHSLYKRALKPQGRCVIAGFTTLPRLFEHIVVGAWMSKTGNRTIGLMGVAKPNQKDLLFVKALLKAGKVVPVIDRRYPLRDTAEAIRYLEAGHAHGKVIITVEQNNKT